jgi:hypothetical protein
MRKYSSFFLSALILFMSSLAIGSGQDSESYLQQFQRNLMDSFIGKLSADGITATPRQRAMFMGYLLNRQAQRQGKFATDKIRMASLVAEVKAFLESVSAGEDLWPVVVAGMRGEFKQEVDALLGGSAYVEPIFPSLDDMVRDWRKWDYNAELFARYPRNQAVLEVPLAYLQMLKENRYPEALSLSGGRCYDQLVKALSESSSSPEKADQFNRYFQSLAWQVGQAGMTDTDPPMARIMFSLRNPDGKWEEEPCIVILDNGIWKVAKFID